MRNKKFDIVRNINDSFFCVGDEVAIQCTDRTYVEGMLEKIEIKKDGDTLQTLLNVSITEEGYYPSQHAHIWLDEIVHLEILRHKDEANPNQKYEQFTKDCLESIEGKDKKDYIFKLKRWSSYMPFWCIFFCERTDPAVTVIKEHCGLALNETVNMMDLLSTLTNTGIFVKVSNSYFLKMEEDLL